jgi:hypothetical protein
MAELLQVSNFLHAEMDSAEHLSGPPPASAGTSHNSPRIIDSPLEIYCIPIRYLLMIRLHGQWQL